MNVQLCWLNKLDRSRQLPILGCDLMHGHQPFQALITADQACRCPVEQGLVEVRHSTNNHGHIVILELRPLPAVLNFELYARATEILDKGKSNLLIRFVKLLGLVTEAALQPFVRFWWENPDSFLAFLTMPASYRDHHAYCHGLLQHSIEVAELAYTNSVRLQHSEKECQLVLLSGLFHDIGKVYCQSEANIQKYQTGPHECLNFSLLAHPLKDLASSDWNCHRVFSSMLAPYSQHRSNQYAIETIFRNADRMSCASDRSHTIFSDKPSYFSFTKDGDRTVRRLPH